MDSAVSIMVRGKPVRDADLVVVLQPGKPAPRLNGYQLQSTWHDGTGRQVRRYRQLAKLAPGMPDPRD